MKPKKQIKPVKLKLPKGFSIDNILNGKYDDQPFLKIRLKGQTVF